MCFPRQCVTGPSRCEDHMAEGGWSWRRTLMFFSWHELKWWEFKDSICFLFDELRWWGWRRFYYFFSIREDAQLCKICHEPQTTCCITSFLSRLCFFCLFVFFTHKQKFKKKNKVQKVRHSPETMVWHPVEFLLTCGVFLRFYIPTTTVSVKMNTT